MYTLTPETPEDWWEVEALYDTCFAPGREALSSYRLRDDVPPVPELSYVARDAGGILRSEEHTSELQSLTNLVCRLLLEKKKKNKQELRKQH